MQRSERETGFGKFSIDKTCSATLTFLKNCYQVTGGGNGLGRAISLELAQKGCNIAVADVNITAAENTAAEIRKLGVEAKAYKVDVTRSDEIVKLRDLVKTDLGPVDILVSNQLRKNWVV